MDNIEQYLERYQHEEENDNLILGYDQMNSARDNLPVYKQRKQILYSIKHCDVLILSAESGSGKTSQIPQHLLAFNYCHVAVILLS
jgi:HrpA-like RNA helicase